MAWGLSFDVYPFSCTSCGTEGSDPLQAAEDASSVFDVVCPSCLVPCQLSTVKRELEEPQIATAATTSSQQPGQYRFGLTAQWHPPMGDVFGMEPANSWTSEPLRVAGASFRLQLLPVIGERFPQTSLMRCQVPDAQAHLRRSGQLRSLAPKWIFIP